MYANQYGYSDITPFEIVRRISDKTIEIRCMSTEVDPSWKPEFIPGGFAGHCVNQHRQVWIFSSDENAPVIRARRRKDGSFQSIYGRHIIQDKPVKFRDYNF